LAKIISLSALRLRVQEEKLERKGYPTADYYPQQKKENRKERNETMLLTNRLRQKLQNSSR
jgi:hypothetical protein